MKSQTHCKQSSYYQKIFHVKKKKNEKNIFCEEPDSLQKKFLAENILCQEKIF